MTKLDKSKPFGQIFGIHEYGGVFTQGEKCFDASGNEVGPGITKKPAEAPPPAAAAGPAATAPVEEPLAERLAAMHPSQIKKLVQEAGLTPAGGAGSTKVNIAQLLDQAAG